MAQKIDLNVAPYYDDFAENKNFHRILFRPGYAVQARELTQLQSILQNQIERFGSHVFQEGSVVIPGGFSINNEYYSVQLATALLVSQLTHHNIIMQLPVTIECDFYVSQKHIKTNIINTTIIIRTLYFFWFRFETTEFQT